MAGVEKRQSYIFGSFVLETSSASLRRGDKHIPLTPKRYEILLFLVKNAGQLLLKEEIIEQVWPGQFIEEGNLTNSIYAIRRLIEDNPRHPQMIQTVSGRGYRFQADVQVVDGSIPETVKGTDSFGRNDGPPGFNESAEKYRERAGADSIQWLFRHPGGRLALIVLLLLLGSVAAGWTFRRAFYTQSEGVVSFPRPLTSFPGAERFPALSRDGRLIAFTWAGEQQDNDDIYVKQTNESEAIRITTHPGMDRRPAWSPDGRYIAFLRAAKPIGDPNHLLIVPALGGIEREIARVDDGVDWSPDGQFLAVTGLSGPEGGAGIHLIGVNGAQRRRITQQPLTGGIYDSTPRFSPDGRSLAFLRYHSDIGGEVFIADLTSGAIRQITNEQKTIKSDTLQWSADGEKLYFVSRRTGTYHLWQVNATGGIAKFVPNLTTPMTDFSIARQSNALVYVNDQDDLQIEVFERNGNGKRACQINSSLTDRDATWAPDGSQLVFSSNRTGWNELWIARKDCTQLRQLTSFHEFGVGSPRWSPDGRQIAFDRRINEQSDIYTIRVEDGALRKMTDSVWSSTLPEWSPDGEWIYYTSNRAQPNSKTQIWKNPVRGGDPVQVTYGGLNGSREPHLSPDGQVLYFSRDNRLWRLELPNGKESPVSELSAVYLTRDWQIARSGIYYVELGSGTQFFLRHLDLVTGNISLIRQGADRANTDGSNFSISLDEQRYALSTLNYQLSDIMLIDGWK